MRCFSGDKEGRKAAAEYNKRLQELYESKFRDPDNPDEYIGLNKNEVEQKRVHTGTDPSVFQTIWPRF